MAKRSRQSFLKRQRERQRAEKAAEKRMKRLARRSGVAVEAESEPTPDAALGGEPQEPSNVDAETADETSPPAGTPLDKQD